MRRHVRTFKDRKARWLLMFSEKILREDKGIGGVTP